MERDVPYNDPRNDEIQMSRNAQPLRYALSRTFTFNPGVEFNYNGGLTQVPAVNSDTDIFGGTTATRHPQA